MARVNSSDFGKAVKVRLIEMDKTQTWLAQAVSERTGLYFDTSYLSKVLTGSYSQDKFVEAIRDVLGLPEDTKVEDSVAPRKSN